MFHKKKKNVLLYKTTYNKVIKRLKILPSQTKSLFNQGIMLITIKARQKTEAATNAFLAKASFFVNPKTSP